LLVRMHVALHDLPTNLAPNQLARFQFSLAIWPMYNPITSTSLASFVLTVYLCGNKWI